MSIYTAEQLGITLPADKMNAQFFDVREEPFRVYGLYDTKNQPVFRRIPEDVAAATSPNVHGQSRLTAGGRVRFCTNSPYAVLHVRYNGEAPCTAMSPTATRGFDLYSRYNGRDSWIGTACYCNPDTERDALTHVFALDGDKNHAGEVELTLNMPTMAGVKQLFIGLAPDASLSRRGDYRYEKPVLYYGSSITHGGHASRPGMSYEAIISRRLDCDYVNLGFAGSCKAEEAITDYIAALDPSVFVLDYDHNAPNEEYLAATHEKAYLKFRAAHPKTPVIFVGRPDFWLWNPSDVRRRDILYTTYQNALRRGEPVLFVDGYSLFHGEYRE
ncbi:MAG: hypothetical protein E7632_10235, partial [Ruminococcaceae bacterium]|nr:hypothetical protein [Oscillospiraceae bacterium]